MVALPLAVTQTLVIGTAVWSSVAAADSACPHVHDPHSRLASSLLAYTGMDTQDVLHGIALPTSLSTCVGSLDAATLMQAGSVILETPTCFRALDWLTTLSQLTPSAAGLLTPSFFDSLVSKDIAYFDALCAPMRDVLPCLRGALLPILMPVLASQPCCAALLDDSAAQFGVSFDTFVVDAINHVADVVCSTQTPGFNDTYQPCGYTLLASVVATSSNRLQQLVWTVLNALQLPNDQGALAATGAPITTTRNTSTTLFMAPMLPDACAIPLDIFLGWVRLLPIVTSTPVSADLTLSALFEDDQCVPGGQLLQALVQTFPKAISDDLYSIVGAWITDDTTCFHLANGYTTGIDRFQTTVDTFSQTLDNDNR
ncbi:hypothetical protein B5M09_001273 [Aphanomyces astaci]|uniref:Secreted protein n=1 Tax=Aphanomyces astaci TaxID=112090 RepID=A0A3R8DQE4_APHAT|nr:hypothetical protein B5M09_001273 [Aphanomyces astaci]